MSGGNSFSGSVSVGQVFARWPECYATRPNWKYEHRRVLKKGALPSFVRLDGKEIPIFHISQTNPMPKLSGLELAKFEFMRHFWLHARHDLYLLCDERTSTIDWNKRRLAGRKAPYFDERLVEQHLQEKKVYGMFSGETFRSRPAQTYWLAIDLDLHVDTGGNLSIFMLQLKILLDRLWGQHYSQLAASSDLVNGVHLYLYFPVLQSLDCARRWLKTVLTDLHIANPALAGEVDRWNHTLKLTGKNWKVRQINDLEIYPHEKHGFRFIGTKGKMLLAHKAIGLAQWGLYKQGKKKGQAKIGFDLELWWESLLTLRRLPLEEVLDFVKARLPTVQPALPEAVGTKPFRSSIAPTEESTGESLQVIASPTTSAMNFKGNTRKVLTDYWLGKNNPSGALGGALITTARLLAAEGLSQADAEQLLRQYVREIPPEARHCSSRLTTGDWGEIDRQISRTVITAFANAGQPDAETSAERLDATINAWLKCGFRISDKSTWLRPTDKITVPEIAWTEQDRLDFVQILQPALKSKVALITEKVATGIVHLAIIKEQRNEGWGYEYLRTWLLDQFSIKCGKREKQAAVIKACQALHLIKRTRLGRKGQASNWTVGYRALARLNGDSSDGWRPVWSQQDRQRHEEGCRLLNAGQGETPPE